MPRMFFESSYGTIYCETEGSGPPLLMIHGTPFNLRIWDRIKKPLTRRFTVYTYDLLGYGRSEKADDVSLGIQNNVLSQLLDHWGLTEPHAVAHDFGGATLLRSIFLNGRQYKKVLFIDIVALSPWGSPFVQHVRSHEDAFNELPDYIHRAVVNAYIKDAIHNPVSDEDIGFLAEPWLTPEGKKGFYRQIAQMDEKYTREVQEHYREISFPVKIVWGEEDGWIPIAKGKELHRMIRGSCFVTFPRCGHLVQMDNPDAVIREAVEFFRL